jgi:hypothetical protein
MDSSTLHELRQKWLEANQALIVGRRLFEEIPSRRRPGWARHVLKVCCERLGSTPEIDVVLDVAGQSGRWSEGHQAFGLVRRATLREQTKGYPSLEREVLLLLAEAVAKATYNATAPIDPFDDDSDWWVAANAAHLARLCKDEHFTGAVWEALILPFRETSS